MKGEKREEITVSGVELELASVSRTDWWKDRWSTDQLDWAVIHNKVGFFSVIMSMKVSYACLAVKKKLHKL